MQELLEAALEGCRDPEANDGSVEIVVRPALTAAVVEVLEADGFLLASPANIGYLSGAMKHFFDTIYYPCLEATRGRACGAWIHGNLDTTGAVRALESITGGLQWQPVRPAIEIVGQPSNDDRVAVRDLASLLTVTVAESH
jgi:NAD(P)H-dependent FMN reductase